MTYTLAALFLATGKMYVERRHLTLPACAGRLALLRSATLQDLVKLEPRIGAVEYRCIADVR